MNYFDMMACLEELEGTEWGTELTPVELHGSFSVKRDDMFEKAGVRGGKVRSAWYLCTSAGDIEGLCTAGARTSPQIKIISSIAKELDVPCRAHTTTGKLGQELLDAQNNGAEIIQHRGGYNNVLIARSREDAESRGWLDVPFGMECEEAVLMTALQVANLPDKGHLVMPVGSAMSFSGVLWGIDYFDKDIEVTGVVVGADPGKRIAKYAPDNWESMATLVRSEMKYKDYADVVTLPKSSLKVDPIYEAKCIPYLQEGDLFWIVGIR